MYIPDPTTGYRLSPGWAGTLSNVVEYNTTVRVHEAGFRITRAWDGDEPSPVLFLGDSFVFGQGVEASQALPDVLEGVLKRTGPAPRFINAAVPGYSTSQQVSWLRTYGLALDPRMVIVGVFLGNDLEDNQSVGSSRWQLRGPGGPHTHTLQTRVTEFLYANSHLYRLIRSAVVDWRTGRAAAGGPDSGAIGMAEKFGVQRTDSRLPGVMATRVAVRELASVRDSSGVQVLAVLIPEAVQVVESLQDEVRRAMGSQEELDWTTPNHLFGEILEAEGIPFLDLTDEIRSSVADSIVYWEIDGHWNAAGHRAAARATARWLVERPEWLAAVSPETVSGN